MLNQMNRMAKSTHKSSLFFHLVGEHPKFFKVSLKRLKLETQHHKSSLKLCSSLVPSNSSKFFLDSIMSSNGTISTLTLFSLFLIAVIVMICDQTCSLRNLPKDQLCLQEKIANLYKQPFGCTTLVIFSVCVMASHFFAFLLLCFSLLIQYSYVAGIISGRLEHTIAVSSLLPETICSTTEGKFSLEINILFNKFLY